MPPARRVQAVFDRVEPVRSEARTGVEIGFRRWNARLGPDRIDDFADLGPALTVPAVAGIGKVVRILRAARVAAPREPLALAGRVEEVSALLERALGRRLQLEVRPRSRIHFVAWTEAGVETVHDVAEVIEDDHEYLVVRHGGRFPVRFARDAVSRQQTRSERWYEVVGVERA